MCHQSGINLRKERVTTSHFREVCHVRGDKSADMLAERIIQGVRQTAHMKRGLDMEAGALKDYARGRQLVARGPNLARHQ